jgi:hypothetical protein
VQYNTTNGTAVTPGDYTSLAATTLSFAAGETSKSVTVNVVGDTVVEADETFNLVLSAPVGGVLSDSSGTASIINNEFASFAVTDLQIFERNTGTTAATFTITRSGSTAGAASVRYSTTNGTAVAPGDYGALAVTTVSFAAAETSKSVTVNVVGDTVSEAEETFNLVLSAPVGGAVADGSGTATIINDDFSELSINDRSIVEGNAGTSVMSFTVTRSGATSGAASFKYATANSSATAGSDYTGVAATSVTFAAGETVKIVSVTITGDTVVEPAETFTVNLSQATGVVIADAAGVGVINNDD